MPPSRSHAALLFLLAGCLAATGCSTVGPAKQAAPTSHLSEQRASNDVVEVQLVSVAGATDGWLEYQVSVSNRSSHFLQDLRAVLVDKEGNEYVGYVHPRSPGIASMKPPVLHRDMPTLSLKGRIASCLGTHLARVLTGVRSSSLVASNQPQKSKEPTI